MGWLSTAGRPLVSLFIDDGSLALAILAWLAACEICFHLFGGPGAAAGILLGAGFAVILAENVARTSRSR